MEDVKDIASIKENGNQIFYIKQFRKKKRSLHEDIARKGRKEPNRTQKNAKEINGWYLNDKVVFRGKVGWIRGFSGTSAYIVDINGDYIQMPNKTYKQITLSKLKFICHNNTWQYSAGIYPTLIENGGLLSTGS